MGGRGEAEVTKKNVDHHGWLTEKNLGFEWPKTAQMALIFYVFIHLIGGINI